MVTHWVRQRLDVGETEISVPQVPDAVREWVASDPETTTYQFVLASARLGSRKPAQDAARGARGAPPAPRRGGELAAAREELGELRPLRQEEVESLRAEIAAVRRAHEVQAQRLVNERVGFAEGVAHVQAAVYGSRSWRLTTPLRAASGLARRLRG